MQQAGVDEDLIRERLENGKFEKVLPFRFLTAAKYAPVLEDSLEKAMYRAIATLDAIPGKTGVLIDGSGSMSTPVSDKSEVRRIDVAAALAIILREKCPLVRTACYSTVCKETAPRHGIALGDALRNVVPSEYTYLKRALIQLKSEWKNLDRIIVITDEQSHDGIEPCFVKYGYVVNVAQYQYGVGYGNGWQNINGFSERILDYILAVERENTLYVG